MKDDSDHRRSTPGRESGARAAAGRGPDAEGEPRDMFSEIHTRDNASAPVVMSGGAPPSAVRGRGERVLVVDDEPLVRTVCCSALEACGYRTIQAEDGRDAVERFEHADPPIDLVLTDLSMPRMDGPTAIARIRERNARVPIVAMSGLAAEFRAEGVERHGLVGLLEKPFEIEDLLRLVGGALAADPRD